MSHVLQGQQHGGYVMSREEALQRLSRHVPCHSFPQTMQRVKYLPVRRILTTTHHARMSIHSLGFRRQRTSSRRMSGWDLQDPCMS
jgi:hypothetical protein